jgi:hypothetical protein
MKAIFIFKYCCWTAIKHRTRGVFCFQTSFGYKRIFVQSKKSIFGMQYVCNVLCKCVVAHAYTMVAKLQGSSG